MPSIIEEYDSLRGLHHDFCRQTEALVQQLLKAEGISIHSISSRIKERDSVAKKLARKGQKYNSIKDITDVVGIRIITYFADQVDQVSKLIENEFKIDKNNSVDKRSALDPDRFGYLSVHYVVSLADARCALTENRSFNELKLEIQIRSILQHAWAEIEHDLGYKTKGEVPAIIRRQFARLAGLLELGDGEFVKIREALDEYEASIKDKINETPKLVELDKVSLTDFLNSEALVKDLDLAIASGLKCELKPEPMAVSGEIERLAFFQIVTVGQLKDALEASQQLITKLAAHWGDAEENVNDEDEAYVTPGISIFYLGHILVGRNLTEDEAVEYFQKFSIGYEDLDQKRALAKELIEFVAIS